MYSNIGRVFGFCYSALAQNAHKYIPNRTPRSGTTKHLHVNANLNFQWASMFNPNPFRHL